jgi:hypothetical protein
MLMQRHLTRPSLADVMVREGILPRRTVDQVVARLGGSTTAFGPDARRRGDHFRGAIGAGIGSPVWIAL